MAMMDAELTRVLTDLCGRAGLSVPETRLLLFMLSSKLIGTKEYYEAKELASSLKQEGIHREKIYAYLTSLSDFRLIEASQERPAKFRVKGSATDLLQRLDTLIKGRVEARKQELDTQLQASRDSIQSLLERISKHSLPRMDYYTIPEGELHKYLLNFLRNVNKGEDVSAITPSSVIWSVPPDMMPDDETNFYNYFKQRLYNGEIFARYVIFLKEFQNRESVVVRRRLETLIGNLESIQNLHLLDASQSYSASFLSTFLAIFGSSASVIALKTVSGKFTTGVVFTGHDLVTFFKIIFSILWSHVLESNLAQISSENFAKSYRITDKEALVKSYTLWKLRSLLARVQGGP